MDYININEAFEAVIPIPESALTDTVTYTIYQSAGTVFASGNAAFIAGINWKVSFTPNAAGIYIVEVYNQTLDVKYSQSFKAVVTSTITASIPAVAAETDESLLEKVNIAIGNRLSGGAVQAYSVLGRNIQYETLESLYKLRKELEMAIAVKSGGARNFVSFTNPE